jgi:DNA-binding PadR family transcriptional regulator
VDVKTLCLGLLSFGDACGYDLKKRFESLFRHFYPAGYGSIYPALAELAAAKLVTCRDVPQDGRPDRKVYRITAAGRREFAGALATGRPTHKLRSEFLAMIYFAELMDPQRLDEILDERLRELREAGEHIAAIQRAWPDEAPVGARFVAGFGAVLARVATEYIEQNRHLLSTGASVAPTQPAPRGETCRPTTGRLL